jgi:hypothetical protein
MQLLINGFLAGLALAVVLVVFEYTAITREVAERSKRVAKKVEWDSNQKSRMRGMLSFGVMLTIGGAIGSWWIFS